MQNPAKISAKVVMPSLEIACNGVVLEDYGPHCVATNW